MNVWTSSACITVPSLFGIVVAVAVVIWAWMQSLSADEVVRLEVYGAGDLLLLVAVTNGLLIDVCLVVVPRSTVSDSSQADVLRA